MNNVISNANTVATKSTEFENIKESFSNELNRLDSVSLAIQLKVNQIKPHSNTIQDSESESRGVKGSNHFCDEMYNMIHIFNDYNYRLNKVLEDLNNIV